MHVSSTDLYNYPSLFAWISAEQILLGLLIYSIPAIVASLPFLFAAIGHKKIWFVATVIVWTFILPIILAVSLNIVFDGILDRSHMYNQAERIFFFWVPFYGIPPLLAALIWIKKKQNSKKD